jgi:phage shock protein PspC (stress-responsive transcriptional regulator)
MARMVLDSATPPDPVTPPLRRVREGRWVAGVCRGLASRWDLNVVQVRALFVLATALAGIGVLAYVACWLVLPLDGDDGESPSLVRGMASLALLAAAGAGLATIAVAAAATTVFGFGWAVGVAAAVFLVAALVAWPVVRPAWALAALAAALVPAVAVAASGVRIAPQSGLETHVPSTVADIPRDGYRMGLGDLLVDLRRLEAPAGSVVALRLDTGTGATVVALPRDRCLNLDVRYRTSEAWPLTRRLSRRSYGKRAARFYGQDYPTAGHWLRTSSDPHAPTLKIDYTAVVGTLTVRDYPPATGPLHQPSWPANLLAPASPGARRWAWRDETSSRSVKRRWQRWRKEVAQFEERKRELTAGACAPRESPR